MNELVVRIIIALVTYPRMIRWPHVHSQVLSKRIYIY